MSDGEAERRTRAGVREGLRDVFGDCEEDFGEGEGCDLLFRWSERLGGLGKSLSRSGLRWERTKQKYAKAACVAFVRKEGGREM